MIKLFVSTSLLTLVVATSAFAQSAPADTTATPVGEVVVTGRLERDIPVQLAKQGVRVDIVTAATVKNGDYVDVAQSLQTTVPGLYVAPKNGPFDYVQVSLQGSRTEDVLWLVDGVRINNRRYGGTTPLDTLPASMIERIEVVEGPQALFYGTQSVAGAINIITKDFSAKPDGAISIGGDSNDSFHADGFFRDSIGRSHFVIYGSEDQSRGFQPFPTEDYQPSSTDRHRGYNIWTLGGKYAYDVTNDLRFTVSEQHNQGRVDDAAPDTVASEFNDRDEDILTSKIDYTPSDKLQLYVKGYYHWWRSHYTEIDNDPDTPRSFPEVNAPWGYTDRGANALVKFSPTPKINYYLGYDFQSYSGSDAVLVITQHSESVNAIFGEVATTPALIPNLNLAAGFRYNAPSFGPSATVWNVSGRWDINNFLFVKATAGTAFRLPTAEELFADDPGDEHGDPDLKPETSINANLSIGGPIPGLKTFHWEAIGFYRDVTNLIDFVSVNAADQDVFGNVAGTVKVRGGELILEGDLTPEVSGTLSYTYSSATEGGGQQVTSIPLSLAKAGIDYHPATMPLGLSATLNYVGDVYGDPTGVRENYGDYLVMNVSGRVFIDSARHHRIDIGINNLFDKRYATGLTQGFADSTGEAYVVTDLGQPRTFVARYTYSF